MFRTVIADSWSSATGAEVHHGDLEDLDGLRRAAREADGVVRLAFREDAMRAGDLKAAVAIDYAAIQALGEALAGRGKAFVGASALLLVGGRTLPDLARSPPSPLWCHAGHCCSS